MNNLSINKVVENISQQPLQHAIVADFTTNDFPVDVWSGIRKAGDFFAYDEETVEVSIRNNKSPIRTSVKYSNRGFYISVLTIDDSSLCMDFWQPFDDDAVEIVLNYFNNTLIEGLKRNDVMLEEIQELLGIECWGYSFD